MQTNLNIKWVIEMDTLDAMRKIAKFEKVEEERHYPEFVLLTYQPIADILRHVTGHDTLNLGGKWIRKEKYYYFTRDGTSHRLKDIRALLYLLLSLLKHAGYYKKMKMDPHANPFIVQSMHFELIPQQDDGYSCGVFLMKYVELILAGVKTSWKSVFGQKGIKDIRKAIAIDIYTNGQLCNSQ
ncbi:hypothetical protein Dsin_019478 [Dipteronia sinensis]|uniref:Ubiquitin-like protease family profile domain-containing protein n=1 Tax=Dipteronia sinensis TaxID=43782 RepID=A0AAE0A7U1_9ROSI|nr:hypothetical protein Dsin_019478 [Dipteronia sinensis]